LPVGPPLERRSDGLEPSPHRDREMGFHSSRGQIPPFNKQRGPLRLMTHFLGHSSFPETIQDLVVGLTVVSAASRELEPKQSKWHADGDMPLVADFPNLRFHRLWALTGDWMHAARGFFGLFFRRPPLNT